LSTVLVLLVPELVRRFFSDSKARTSEAVALNQDEDVSLIRPLVDRAALVTDHAVSWQTLEAPVVTRYDPGALFALHNDASPTPSEWGDLGGQRVCTIICYLNDCPTGGATRFSRLMGGITVQPKQGTALVFFPAFSDSLEADERTIHESLPAVETKWIVQLFGRVGPRVPPPLGIPDSYDKL
jgi:prolyl 4-hydroxylase